MSVAATSTLRTLGFARGAGVAGRDEHFADARRLREFPGQRVFAAAGADDQNFHRKPGFGTRAEWDKLHAPAAFRCRLGLSPQPVRFSAGNAARR